MRIKESNVPPQRHSLTRQVLWKAILQKVEIKVI